MRSTEPSAVRLISRGWKYFTWTALMVASLATGKGAERRPNILFCLSDDQSFPHAGAYGVDWVKTPAFDRVAREGLLFMRAYTPNAKCAPSRAAILTGRNSCIDRVPLYRPDTPEVRGDMLDYALEIEHFDRRPAEELYDLRNDPDCVNNLAAAASLQGRREAMQRRLFAALAEQGDPRMAGEGEVFDRYPNAGLYRDFYNRRIVLGEEIHPFWVERTDSEHPDFDPERPHRSLEVSR